MGLKRHIPNALTLCNLLCGCIASVEALQGHLLTTGVLTGIALVFDFLDGMAARLLKVVSPIGKDLDSLADMVTFGLVPGLVMFQLFNLSHVLNSVDDQLAGAAYSLDDVWAGYHSTTMISYVGFLVTLFSCLRLAKFNNDPRQSDSFIGVPTPANAVFIGSLPLVMFTYGEDAMFLLKVPLLIGLCIVSSFLLVSEIRLFSLKFKNLGWHDNRLRYVFLVLTAALIAIGGYAGITLAMMAYLLLSIANNIFSKQEV